MDTILWLQGASCGGDTISFLNSEQPSALTVFDMLGLEILWHPFLSRKQGEETIALFESILAGHTRLDILVLEGAVPNGPDNTGRFFLFHGRPFRDWLLELSRMAKVIMAVGTCAAFGGIVMGNDNVNTLSIPGQYAGFQRDR